MFSIRARLGHDTKKRGQLFMQGIRTRDYSPYASTGVSAISANCLPEQRRRNKSRHVWLKNKIGMAMNRDRTWQDKHVPLYTYRIMNLCSSGRCKALYTTYLGTIL